MINASVSTVGKKKHTAGQAEAWDLVFHSMYFAEIAVSSVHIAGKQKAVRMSAGDVVLELTMIGATILDSVPAAKPGMIQVLGRPRTK